MRFALLVFGVLFALPSFAKVEVQVPVLLHTSRGHKTYNVSEFKSALSAKNMEIPDFVTIRTSEDSKQLSKFADMIDEAGLEKPKGNSLYMELYGTMSDFQGPGVDFPMCYRKVGRVSDDKAMQEAYDLAGGLTDGVLSDQYVVAAYRFYGEQKFHIESDGQDTDWLKQYEKTVLKPGDVQVLRTTNDDGDDVGQDILSLCE